MKDIVKPCVYKGIPNDHGFFKTIEDNSPICDVNSGFGGSFYKLVYEDGT